MTGRGDAPHFQYPEAFAEVVSEFAVKEGL